MSSKLFKAEDLVPVIQKIIDGVKEKNVESGETIELRIGLKGYDSARDMRFRGEVTLPFPKRKHERLLVIADTLLAKNLEGTDIPFVDVEKYKGKTKEDKKLRKKLVKSHHSFISVASIYKVFEPQIFTRKKKPIYMIKNVNDIKNFYEETKRKVQLNLKADMLMGFAIGTTKMPAYEVAQNMSAAMATLLTLTKKGMQNIKTVHIKATQGQPVKYY